ncbi:MAG: hypothetical protein M3376_01265 [Actinomycetota bacterium]|nr:hypothetical protein [Actinomycetota bacterium]
MLVLQVPDDPITLAGGRPLVGVVVEREDPCDLGAHRIGVGAAANLAARTIPVSPASWRTSAPA